MSQDKKRRIWRHMERRYGCLACVYCGEAERTQLTLDHILPARFGGDNKIDNLTIACYTCNGKRGSKLFFGFRNKQ